MMAGPRGGSNSGGTKSRLADFILSSGMFRGPLSPTFASLASYIFAISGFIGTGTWRDWWSGTDVSALDAFLRPPITPDIVWFSSIVCVCLFGLITVLKRIYPPETGKLTHFAWANLSIPIFLAFTGAVLVNPLTLPGTIAAIAITLTVVELVRLDLRKSEAPTRRRLYAILIAFLALVCVWFVNGFLGLLYFESYEPSEILCSLFLVMLVLMAVVGFFAFLEGRKLLRDLPGMR
jgi:hypothetical protein